MKELRVLFVHGLEGSPRGAKAVFLDRHFTAHTPAMNTSDFAGCVAQQEKAIEQFHPDVVVGSSFGGGVVVELLRRRAWTGPTLLLAQAAAKMGVPLELPEGVRVLLVHSPSDEVVDIEGSRVLAQSGSPETVSLLEVDDSHGLRQLVESGRLAELVREVAEA